MRLKERLNTWLCNIKKIFNFPLGISHEELAKLSKGSPGAFIENLQAWKEIPERLWPHLKNPPKTTLDALSLAREISETLNIEQQIWLISWLQNHIWNKNINSQPILQLEKLRSQLMSYVQPRLAWEVTLLKIIKQSFKR